MDESKNITPTDAERMAGYRVVILSQLLIEAELNLMATMNLPQDQVTPERIQDAALHSVQQAINNITVIVKEDNGEAQS